MIVFPVEKTKLIPWILLLLFVIVISILTYYGKQSQEQIEWDYSKTTEKILCFNQIRSETVPGRPTTGFVAPGDLRRSEVPISSGNAVGRLPGPLNEPISIVPNSPQQKQLFFLVGPDNKGQRIALGEFDLINNMWLQALYNTKFIVNHIETQLPSGEINNYYQLSMKSDPNEGPEELRGKTIGIQVESSHTIIAADRLIPKKQFRFFNPRFGLGLVGYGSMNAINRAKYDFGLAPMFQASFMGYGLTPNDQSLKLIELAVSSDSKSLGVGFAPISLRFWDLIPNTYFQPLQIGIRFPYKTNFLDVYYFLGIGFNVGL